MAETHFTITEHPPVPGSVLLSDCIVQDFNVSGRIDAVPRIGAVGRMLGRVLGQQVEPPTAARVVEIVEHAMNEVVDPDAKKHFGHRDFILEALEAALPELEERKSNV
ncbi:hypothetical protein H6800_00620 [Candidatus Nomurabacteria bacterium]|nr:hypothetical protein [Candidatus Nomurabacteria bacterium]